MKKTLAIAAVAVTMMTGCQTSAQSTDKWIGPILGGVAGGFVGNQFGKGRGKTIATAIGAVGGVVLGQRLQQPVQVQPNVVYTQPRQTVGAAACGQYRNPAARAQCNRGVADRLSAHQRAVERQAYNVGRGQGYNVPTNGQRMPTW